MGAGPADLAVIEGKSGAKGKIIWKRDINQLAGSAHWCQDQYGSDARVLPVVMDRSNIVQRTGTPPPGTRVITVEKLDCPKAAFRAFLTALAQDYGYRHAEKVARQLKQQHLGGGAIVPTYTVAGRRKV
jgi:hypothetical protein